MHSKSQRKPLNQWNSNPIRSIPIPNPEERAAVHSGHNPKALIVVKYGQLDADFQSLFIPKQVAFKNLQNGKVTVTFLFSHSLQLHGLQRNSHSKPLTAWGASHSPTLPYSLSTATGPPILPSTFEVISYVPCILPLHSRLLVDTLIVQLWTRINKLQLIFPSSCS